MFTTGLFTHPESGIVCLNGAVVGGVWRSYSEEFDDRSETGQVAVLNGKQGVATSYIA